MESLLTLAPPAARLIVFGDIHGCFDEMLRLLGRIAPTPDDLVIAAGDIVRKGPEPLRCLELWRDRGYLAVVGNNEEKLLATSWWRRLFLPAGDRAVLRRPDLVQFIESWPVVIDLPEAGATIVHGGLLPHMNLTERDVEAHRADLIRLRWLRRTNGSWERVPKGKQQEGDVLWPSVWDGERTVLYGHTPLREPRVEPRAIGLDTGCVYGGSLTAAIREEKAWKLVSEPARRAYSSRQELQ